MPEKKEGTCIKNREKWMKRLFEASFLFGLFLEIYYFVSLAVWVSDSHSFDGASPNYAVDDSQHFGLTWFIFEQVFFCAFSFSDCAIFS
jgi:hypothetical protein